MACDRFIHRCWTHSGSLGLAMAFAAGLAAQNSSSLPEVPAEPEKSPANLAAETATAPKPAAAPKKRWKWKPAAKKAPVGAAAADKSKVPAAATALGTKAAELPRTAYTASLKELGYQDGILLEQTQEIRTVFFSLPRDIRIPSASLRLRYTSSEILKAPSNFRVLVNGLPRAVVGLANNGGKGELNLALAPGTTDKNYLDVQIQTALIVSGNLCVDEAARGGFVHIQPDSGITYDLPADPLTSIRAYWQLLPPAVTIAVSSTTLDPAAFYTAWMLGSTLQRGGKDVRFVRLPELGDIVIATGKELAGLNGDDRQVSGNVALRSAGGRRYLGIREPYHFGQITALNDPWIDLSSGRDYRFQPVEGFKANGTGVVIPVKLTELGLSDSARAFRRRAEFGIYVRPRQLPPGYRPTKLQMSVVSTPGERDKSVHLNVFVNDRLLEVARLADHGKPQQLLIDLPSHYLRSENRFRISTQVSDPDGTCNEGGMVSNYQIQILPDSVLLTELDPEPPRFLSQVVTYLGDRFTTYLPDTYLFRPERVLPFLSKVSSDLGFHISDPARIRYYAPTDRIQTDGPFLLIGKGNLKKVDAPVRFDKGLKVTDDSGRVVYNVDNLPGITVAQVARVDEHRGLWLNPGETPVLPATQAIAAADGDLLFIDHGGALLSMDSRKMESVRITHGLPSWFETLGAYRYWLLALGWLVTSVLFLKLYRKVQKHKTV